MFTQEQEDFLASFADKGIAELAEVIKRNEIIDSLQPILKSKEEALSSLKTQQAFEYEMIEKSFDEQITKITG